MFEYRLAAFLLRIKAIDDLPIIISLVSLIISIFSILLVEIRPRNEKPRNEKPRNEKRKRALTIIINVLSGLCITLALILCAVCIWVSVKTIQYDKNYSLVPDIYGMTYDDALSSLRDAGLDGRLALASTNEDLTNADTRVVWQSKEAGIIIDKGSNVMFVIDDNFALESFPLSAFTTEKKTNTTGHEWYWDADKSGENWEVKVPINQFSAQGSTKILNGVYKYSGAVFTLDLYSTDMNSILSEIVDQTCSQYAPDLPIADMYLIGKLIPAGDTNQSALDCFSTSLTHGIMILPKYLMEGKYQFAFCLCDKDGNSYEWRHTIMVVSNEEWTSVTP